MAIVYIPAPLVNLTGGKSRLEVQGATVRQIIDNLEQTWPGIRDRFVAGDRLRPNISVAVDGEVSPLGLLERVSPSSEVHFVAAISGGAQAAR
ncbi:MAG TPA: MoaD/ThiS family protein [Terriglobia bacterium]|nr:MoaD/ThiS family protein [Terriglobia bacterium]